jgi:hypothetical protein
MDTKEITVLMVEPGTKPRRHGYQKRDGSRLCLKRGLLQNFHFATAPFHTVIAASRDRHKQKSAASDPPR